MDLKEKDIKKIRRIKGYAGISPRLWFSITAAAIFLLLIIIPIVGYYSCCYNGFQFWEKLATILIPVAVGFASIILAIAASAPKIKFAIKEKQFEYIGNVLAGHGFQEITGDKNNPIMKQHFDMVNEHGLPVEVEVTVYFGRREFLSTEKINEREYKFSDGGEKIKLAPRATYYWASFHIKGVKEYKKGDLLLVKISARNTFAKLSNLYQLWYYDDSLKSLVPDVFFRNFN